MGQEAAGTDGFSFLLVNFFRNPRRCVEFLCDSLVGLATLPDLRSSFSRHLFSVLCHDGPQPQRSTIYSRVAKDFGMSRFGKTSGLSLPAIMPPSLSRRCCNGGRVRAVGGRRGDDRLAATVFGFA